MFSINDLQSLPILQLRDDYNLSRALSKHEDQDQTNGNINMNEDYTGGEDFSIFPEEEDDFFAIFRILVNIRDSGSFDSGGYGNGGALPNGFNMIVQGDGLPPAGISITPITITRTTDWQIYAHDLIISTFGSGDQIGSIRWTFSKGGFPLILRGWKNQKLTCRLNDDMSFLQHQYIFAQGVRLKRADLL